MKLPSIQFLLNAAYNSLKRFPLVLLSSAMATFIVWYLIHKEIEPEVSPNLFKLLLCFGLGISLFFAAQVLVEQHPKAKHFILLPIIPLAIYFFSLPHEFSEQHFLQLLLFGLASHLLVAIIPYFFRGQILDFWSYNKALFIRILTALLFTGVLMGGLSIALLGVENLLNVNISGKSYAYLNTGLLGFFNTWFFVSGVPKRFNSISDKVTEFKEVKIFAQYVLLPLVLIYFTILYLYLGKIILTQTWPSGMVALLVMCLTISGTLCFLLLYPYANEGENKWIKGFSKWFYILLLLPIAMYAYATWARINQYGLTEPRFYLVLLGFWALACSLYFISSRKDDIRFIPLSLLVAALIGALFATPISVNKQMKRLKNIFISEGKYEDGKFLRLDSDTKENAGEAWEILKYLDERNKLGLVTKNVGEDLVDKKTEFLSLTSTLNISRESYYAGVNRKYVPFGVFRSKDNDKAGVEVSEVDLYFPDLSIPVQGNYREIIIDNQSFSLQIAENKLWLLDASFAKISSSSVEFWQPLLKDYSGDSWVEVSSLDQYDLAFETDTYYFFFKPTNINGEFDNEVLILSNVVGALFVNRKETTIQ